MFYDIDNCDIASYADDNTTYTSDFNLEEVIQKLELITNNLFEWFKNNHMKANTDNCHLLVTKDTGKKTSWCQNRYQAFVRESCFFHLQNGKPKFLNFMDLAKRKTLMKAFITSQFNYCPLVWMFHSRQLNNLINKIHESALRLLYKDNKLTFNDLLELHNSVTIHQRNLQILATETFKVKKQFST